MRPVALILVLAASWLPASVPRYGPETWFEQDPAPVPVVAESIGNPLDYAGARIGLDVRNVELPRGWEGGYRYCCRFPIIDYVSNRPLYMKQWTEDRSAALVAFHRQKGLGVAEYATSVLSGVDRDGARPMSDSGRTTRRVSPYEGELGEDWRWNRDVVLASGIDSLRGAFDKAGLRPEFRDRILGLYWHMYKAFLSCRQARAGLVPGDSAYFADNPGRYLAPDGRRIAELTGNTEPQMEFIERARRVTFTKVLGEVPRLTWAASRYVAATRGWGPADFYDDTAALHGVVRLGSPLGPVVIAGYGNDRHVENAALLIDLGGNDTYTNNAGGCGRSGGVAVCIDHSGNDRYEAPDSSYVQGFGFLGVGMLVDLGGDDVYKAKHFSQGAGILGVGVLWDKAGNDSFSAHTFCQGAGMFGLGMVLDDSGDDIYDCASNGQGSATTLGFGVLSDLDGNDKYRLAVDTTKDAMGGLPGYGQGGALSFRAYPWEKKLVAYGGVGLLVDNKGNDDYVSNGWNSQGGSYIMSLGALVDNEGNDRYKCGTGQGSGIHVTNAILIDKKGDDVYEGGFRAGGSGSDRSPGFLIDYEGNDIYKSATSSYGTGCKPSSYSLFIDYKGDDQYICERPKGAILMNDWHSFGGVWPESDPNAWPYAISLDLGGKDKYDVRNRANNSETHSFGHGIHLDMEWNGGDIVGVIRSPRVGGGHYESVYTDWITADIYVLAEHNLFWKFSTAGGLLARSHDSVVGKLIPALMGPDHELSSGLMECLHYWFVQGKIGRRELPEVLKLLKARDPEVRLIIADDLGLWKMRGAEDALVEAAKGDSNAQVRRFALRSLLRLESVKALPIARKLATEDTSEDVRRMAVTLVGKVRPSGEVLPLLRWVLAEDKASSVRCAAADAMGNLGNPDAVEYLREAARRDMTETAEGGQSPALKAPQSGTVPAISDRVPSHPDVYAQRACARALCQLYQVEGIQMLINSLSFPSIDAFYNYDRNVPNYISAYAGFDLPDSERYVQAKWQQWFDTHKDSIDIKANADAFRAYTAMTDSLRGEPDSVQLPRYESFLVRFPNHTRAKAEFAGKLNSLAWSLVTTGGNPGLSQSGFRSTETGTVPVVSAALQTGLKYALRAAELSDDPNIWDTLIEAYLANGMKEDALRAAQEALKKHPDNQMLKDRLLKIDEKR